MKQNNSFIWWVLPLVFILMLFASVKLVSAQGQEEEKSFGNVKHDITKAKEVLESIVKNHLLVLDKTCCAAPGRAGRKPIF